MADGDPQMADRGPRTRATGSALLVELLEERVLLSKGQDGFGGLDDHGGLDGQAASLAKQQVVQVKVADLVADGLGSVIQGLPVQNGQVQAIRTGDTLQIGNAFFQYASGQGYPLVPVNGPALPGDVGVPRGPMPVLLPMTEPAPAMVSTPTTATDTSSLVAAAAVPEVAAPSAALAVATESVLPVAAQQAPVGTSISPSSEPVSEPAASTLIPAPTAAVQGTVAAATVAIAASTPAAAAPSAASAVAATPNVPATIGSANEVSAAVPAGSASSPVPASVPASASVTAAASTEPATSDVTRDSNGSEPGTPAVQTAAAVVVIAANVPSSAAATLPAATATATASGTSAATNNSSLPASAGLPPVPAAVGDRSSRDQGGSDEQAGTQAAAVATDGPVAASSAAGDDRSPTDVDQNGSVRLADSGEPVVDTIGDEAVGPAEAVDEPGEASEDGELPEGVAPFIVGSVAALAWGNYLRSANPAERRDDRESDDGSGPEADEG